MPCRQTRYADIPISVYKIVQTGPNIQFGPLKNGYFKESYHIGIAEIIKIAPINPAK